MVPFVQRPTLDDNSLSFLCEQYIGVADELKKLKDQEKPLDKQKSNLFNTIAFNIWSRQKEGVIIKNKKLTLVGGYEENVEVKFDEKKFKKEHPDLYKEYLFETPTYGKSSYLRITDVKQEETEELDDNMFDLSMST